MADPLFTIHYDFSLNKKMIKGKILFRGEAMMHFEKPIKWKAWFDSMAVALNHMANYRPAPVQATPTQPTDVQQEA